MDEAYANMESMMRSNGTLPSLPNRPTMPAFCSGPDTTLYILGGCTVQVRVRRNITPSGIRENLMWNFWGRLKLWNDFTQQFSSLDSRPIYSYWETLFSNKNFQNNKVYIAGKYARELNEMEKEKLEEFSKQMVAQNLAAMAAANATAQVFWLNFSEYSWESFKVKGKLLHIYC